MCWSPEEILGLKSVTKKRFERCVEGLLWVMAERIQEVVNHQLLLRSQRANLQVPKPTKKITRPCANGPYMCQKWVMNVVGV